MGTTSIEVADQIAAAITNTWTWTWSWTTDDPGPQPGFPFAALQVQAHGEDFIVKVYKLHK